MGKKVKSKGHNPRRPVAHRPAAAAAARPAAEKLEVLGVGEGEENREACSHYGKDTAELNSILARIQSSADAVMPSCEHCREEPASKRRGKEKGRQAKKKGGARASLQPNPEVNSIWFCLDCGRGFCGGDVNMSEPYGHARRHSKQERHPWAARSDNLLVCWCFMCNSTVPITLPEVTNGELKSRTEEGSGDSVAKRTENGSEPGVLDGMRGYTVRGLTNLGNTCFLNSVMQNLFSIDLLREYFVKLDRPVGPITIALKKLFMETCATTDSRSVLSPKGLLGCICAKAPQFRGYQQQDSHEYLRCLLDGLYTEEMHARKLDASDDVKDKGELTSGATFVDKIFVGQLSSTVCCVECGHTSVVHEPFLDLSLPVPTKKVPLRKVLPPPPKKTKPHVRDMNRGRRFREKGSANVSTTIESQKEDCVSSPSECSKSEIPAPEQEHIVPTNKEDSTCWLDYLGPDMASDAPDPVLKNYEASVDQPSDGGQTSQSEENAKCVSESHTNNCSKELIASSDFCGESSCRDEVPLSCVQDSHVILLPYKELDLNVDEMNKVTLCSENSESVNALGQESSVQTSSTAGPEQAEEDFGIFGDLFDEPETTFDLKVETSTTEEMDVSLWAGNSSESNQEEIDDSSTPVSVNSCLSLFTKPELLLSNEHGWYCDHCSEILSTQDEECRKGSQQAAARFNHPEASKIQEDGNEVRNKEVSCNPDLDGHGRSKHKAIDNGTATSTLLNKGLNVERVGDPIVNHNVANKLLSLVAQSESSTSASSDQTHNHCVVHEDEVSGGSGHAKSLSYTSGHERISSEVTSDNQENGSCSMNDQNDVNGDELGLPTASSSSPDGIEEITRDTCENDSFSEVNRKGKKHLQLQRKVHRTVNSGAEEMKPERMKVKRDATKRFLINKAPPILTIHLKRFSQDAHGRLNKLSGHISFQETLDLRPYTDPRCEEEDKCFYHLVGVVEHSGTMRGGHYVAYVRGEKSIGLTQKGSDSLWFYANDASVGKTSLSEVLRSEAYILFYERV